jgi:ribosomal protein S18 acetylase RimI-like enzyme
MATIRPMTPADYAVVAAIAADAATKALVGMPLWETEADVAAEAGAAGPRAFVVAEDDDGTVVGVAGYRLLAGGEAELYGPLVTAAGHGLGAWLESRVVALAQQGGATAVSMLIGLDNRSGAAWAEWRGYQRDSEQPELLIGFLYPGELPPAMPAAGGARVRPAAPADGDRLDMLFQECFPQQRPGPSSWLKECWVVLTAGGELAGFARLEQTEGWLSHLCVDPAMRHQGLGSLLVADVVRQYWAARLGRRVGLAVPLDSTGAVSLFRRLGCQRPVPAAKWMKR